MSRYARAVLLSFLLMGGCAGPVREARFEIADRLGTWRISGADQATIELNGWTLTISDTKVSRPGALPILEAVTLRIVNTSNLPLYLERDHIFVKGLGPPLKLSPRKQVKLGQGQSWSMEYDQGRNALRLEYPFELTVTVFWSPHFKLPERVKIKLH